MLISSDAKHSIEPVVTGMPRLPHRRRLGLALGAGSARGWAHIGVLRELADHGIVPDVVAGTSVGAVVGAAYAAGKIDALETFARSITRGRLWAFLDFSLSGTGLIAGARLKRRLSRDLAGLSIETLALPFAAVAAELSTGQEIWLTRGDLIDAVRASYALPGIFEPVQVEGRWLFDGALVNPVPVSVCRSLGADIVIAVNLTGVTGERPPPGPAMDAQVSAVACDDPVLGVLSSLVAAETPRRGRSFLTRRVLMKKRDGMPGFGRVMMEAFSISQDRISRARLAADPADIMINARLTTCGLFDFHRAADLIEHGRAVVRRALPEIEALLAESGPACEAH